MKIPIAMKKLHEVYENPAFGCIGRAGILWYIMRDKGLNPERKLFSFKDSGGNRKVLSHCIVILDGKVYDANIGESPIEFNKYEKMKNNEQSELKLVWEDWETSITGKDYTIEHLWKYILGNFDGVFQKELRPLMEEDIQKYLKDRPHIKRF